MSGARSIAAFPARYLAIAGQFQAGQRRVELKERTEKAAATLRLDLYSFRAALRHEGNHDYPAFMAVRMFLRGRKLVLVHADEPIPV